MLFSDYTSVSILCISFVAEELSVAHVSIFLLEFVLPSITALHPVKSHSASRVLVTILLSVVRDRPMECFNSLLIPRCSRFQEDPSKTQVKLNKRLLDIWWKKCNIPMSDLSQLGIKTADLKWTEYSIALMTTCIKKKLVSSVNPP